MSRIVLKIGGGVAANAADLVATLATENEVCVVHGAGPQITEEMRRRGIEVRFVGGRRVTTAVGLEVVRESLAAVNAALCSAIGPRAVSLSEVLDADRVPALGYVGTPVPSAPPAIESALAAGRVPVVAPLAAGPLNVNADAAAAALAIGLGADRLLFLTDVPGLLLGGAVAATIGSGEASRLLDAGAFEGGIVPKLRAAVEAARGGVRAEIGATAVLA
jgi:acetylglutamate kinase